MIAGAASFLRGVAGRALPWLALGGAVILCMVGALRSGERAGRLAERLETERRGNAANRRMLEAAGDRPRDRDDLVERLRGGGF